MATKSFSIVFKKKIVSQKKSISVQNHQLFVVRTNNSDYLGLRVFGINRRHNIVDVIGGGKKIFWRGEPL